MTKNAPSADDYTNAEEDGFEPEDADEVPARSSMVQRGWGKAKKVAAESSGFAQELNLKEGAKLIKFLEVIEDGEPVDGPVAIYGQHFVKELEGKKSHLCRLDIDTDCPFCDAGIRQDKKFAFSVVEVTNDELVSMVLTVGPKLLDILSLANDGRNGPLTNGYWELLRSGAGLKTSYQLTFVPDLVKDGIDEAKFLARLKEVTPLDVAGKILRYTDADEMVKLVASLP